MPILLLIIFIADHFYIFLPLAILLFVLKHRSNRSKKTNKHNNFINIAVSETNQLHGHNQLEMLAKNTGLTFTPGTFSTQSSLTGNYRGIPIIVHDERHAIGEHFAETTTFKALLNNNQVPPGLRVYPKSDDSLYTNQLGDPELDPVFVINGADSAHTQAFFARPAVKQCFLELRALAASFCMENNTLSISYERELSAHHQLVHAHLEALARCAHEINGTRLIAHAQPSPTLLTQDSPQNNSHHPW